MQKQLYFLFTIVAISILACQPMATFDKPQPADVASIREFPKRIQGKYLCPNDSSLLQITANSMIRTYDFYQKVHITQLDSTQQIIGDSLFDLASSKGQLIQFEGDSIVEHINETDTFFMIDNLNVLKKFKGYYFANIYMFQNNWHVRKLELSQGKLKLSDINQKEDIAQLKAITETAQDTAPYVFSPTRNEFKKFVRNDGFRNSEEFIKIRE